MAGVEPAAEQSTKHGRGRGTANTEQGAESGAADTVRLQLTVREQLL